MSASDFKILSFNIQTQRKHPFSTAIWRDQLFSISPNCEGQAFYNKDCFDKKRRCKCHFIRGILKHTKKEDPDYCFITTTHHSCVVDCPAVNDREECDCGSVYSSFFSGLDSLSYGFSEIENYNEREVL